MPYRINAQSYDIASRDLPDAASGHGYHIYETTESYTAEALYATSDAKGGNGGGGGGGKKPTPPEDPVDPVDPPSEPVLTTGSFTSGPVDANGDVDRSGYNIDVDFLASEWFVERDDGNGGTETIDLTQAFIDAANFISSVISGDRPEYIAPTDGSGFFAFDIDDLYITAELITIDGESGVLGRAGPTHVIYDNGETPADRLPFAGLMEFDIADALALYDAGMWDEVILHEMMHVMGLGTMWDEKNMVDRVLVDDNGTKRPVDDTYEYQFNGSDDFMADFGIIIVEDDGGSGTAGGHWDDETYDGELMTGYLYDSNGDQPNGIGVTQMSFASLADIGYALDTNTGSTYDLLPSDPYEYA